MRALRIAAAIIAFWAVGITIRALLMWNDGAADYCAARLLDFFGLETKQPARLRELRQEGCPAFAYRTRELPQLKAVALIDRDWLYVASADVALVSRTSFRISGERIAVDMRMSSPAARVRLPDGLGAVIDITGEGDDALRIIGETADYRVDVQAAGTGPVLSEPVATAKDASSDRKPRLMRYHCDDIATIFPEPSRHLAFVETMAGRVALIGHDDAFVVEKRETAARDGATLKPLTKADTRDFHQDYGGIDHIQPVRGDTFFIDGTATNYAVRILRTAEGWRISQPMSVPRPIRAECIPRGLMRLLLPARQDG